MLFSIYFAEYFGVSERVIGLTLVAIGTSLPELVTTLVAIYKSELDISIGNIIGSNIFNILAVIGLTSIVTDLNILSERILSFDIYVMILFSLILCLLFIRQEKIFECISWNNIPSFICHILHIYNIKKHLIEKIEKVFD